MALKIFEIDPTLQSVQGQIWERVNGYKHWQSELEKNEGGIEQFAKGYTIFGWNRVEGGWCYREWLPNAKQVFLIGEFNQWQNTCPLKAEGFGRWAVVLPDQKDGSPFLPHKTQIKVRLEAESGSWHDRVPAWTKLAWQDTKTNLFNGVFWEPPAEQRFRFRHARPAKPENLKIYEAHVGMGSVEPKVATYLEFAETVLPRIKRLGYNAVQLMAVAEHAHYGCFGYHVTSFFAPASRSGTPEELMHLVDTAHGLGIHVLMDLVHAHASSNTLDGIAQMDGTDHCYTHGGPKGHHTEWDSKIFDYTKHEVMRFLLSNIRWWLEEYGFDGFRFDGVTSMLYHSHGIGKGYTGGYHEYFGPDANIDTHVYLMLANDLIHRLVPSAISVGEDVSGMPTLCLPVEWGGFGFDYRLAMAIPDMFIKMLKETGDENWDMGHITHTLTNRRWKEKVVAYTESHDQAIVGDKTLAFWLMDAAMYTDMSLFVHPQHTPPVDRGLALHKMIRLLVLGLGGEAYLAFMGNEFGHPEWVDFPRPENDWSHHHCRRRWDLAEDELLRYKFFQAFDEIMNACENRFVWLNSEHQFVSLKDNSDKVIVFERGALLFVFNFHPTKSFEGYQLGCGFDEPMRVVLDTDEGRFGGHCRLEYGHGNSFPLMSSAHSRAHSLKMYLPARTAQVLVKESTLKGGVKIWLEDTFLRCNGLTGFTGLKLKLQNNKEWLEFDFNEAGCVALSSNFDAVFKVCAPDGTDLKCLSSKDGFYRVYFPGDYTVASLGYIKNWALPGAGVVYAIDEKKAPAAHNGYTSTSPPVAPVAMPTALVAPKPAETPADKPVEKLVEAERPVAKPVDKPVETPAEKPAQVTAQRLVEAESSEPPSTELPKPQGEQPEDPAGNVRDMSRCYSGLHFLSAEAIAEAEAAPHVPMTDAETLEGRLRDFSGAQADIGGDVKAFSLSYRTFGLQRTGTSWSFREWLPDVKAAFLVGDFNSWDTQATALSEESEGSGIFSATIPKDQVPGLAKGSKYKLFVHPQEGAAYYLMPAWATRYVYTEATRLLDAVVWPLEGKAPARLPRKSNLVGERVYELHAGLTSSTEGEGFKAAIATLLPRVARMGYSAVLLMGALECKEYSSMGLQPVNLFAASRVLGVPEDVRDFVTSAHGLGLRVYFSMAHDGVACCEDGLGAQFFVPGDDGFHATTGARVFNYSKPEVARYLLASLSFWEQEFGVDGFRFQGVGGMIYKENGRWAPTDCEKVDEWLASSDQTNPPGIKYLMLANTLLQDIGCASIADEHSSFPGLCGAVSSGGLGFDFRQSTNAHIFRELLQHRRDEEWSMSELTSALGGRRKSRPEEKVLSSVETMEDCVIARRPLKIAFLSWETLHTIAAGGVAPHVTELGAALFRAGHEMHIITRSTTTGTWEHPVWGVTYHEVSFGTSSDFVQEIENMCSAFVSRLLQLESQFGKFDIIHGHDWLVGPAIIQLCSMGKRCVFTMHSTETGRCGNVAYGGQSARIRTIESHACHAAQRVIAVSGVLKEEVCNYYNVHSAKISVVYNGIHADPIANMEWQDEWTGNTKKDKGFNMMDPMFLFVGRATVQKGPDLLLEAIPMVLQARANAKFVIVGDGHMKDALVARAGQLGISHAVHFAGAIKSGSPHLKALFKSCDAVVVPSRNEPFGIVVLEAWAAGKPVVATTCGGPRDFVKPDREGYLVDPNPGSIAWGICKICDNFEHARWMGQQAKRKALDEFNWGHIARQTEQIYFEQLCLHGAPRCRVRGAGLPLASYLLGPYKDNMGVLETNHLVTRGLSLLKLIRLVTFTIGADGTSNWMGSEFGQIDSIDMPRPANSFSKDKSNVCYDLADNKGFKYKHLSAFEISLNRTAAVCGWLSSPGHTILVQDDALLFLAYARGGCVFAVNFHPSQSVANFRLEVPLEAKVARELCQALDTEDPRFGGANSAPSVKNAAKVNSGALSVTLKPRSALVFAPADFMPGLFADSLLQASTVDAQLDALTAA